ncbi:MAG TPA: ribonuclease III [Pyrinomonadaceae bacterium]|jgi:ribonuclease-3|nr:ribonuclease III [Pyrinomonadaceae bacterium]
MTNQSGPDSQNASSLEEKLGYTFRDAHLLERALTHRSWAHENVGAGEEEKARLLHNEAFEFVGDSVLGLVVAETLFRSHPEVTEGELSRMKHRLVSTQTLARAARGLQLGEHLRVGRGEEKTGGRRKRAILADTFEAVLAAIYLDGGYEEAAAFVSRALGRELEEASPESAAAADFKTMLQERLQAEQHVMPYYEVVETLGPPHARTFRVEAVWGDERVRGEGRTIKSAETNAARRALERMDAPAKDETESERLTEEEKEERTEATEVDEAAELTEEFAEES